MILSKRGKEANEHRAFSQKKKRRVDKDREEEDAKSLTNMGEADVYQAQMFEMIRKRKKDTERCPLGQRSKKTVRQGQ